MLSGEKKIDVHEALGHELVPLLLPTKSVDFLLHSQWNLFS
jgi:hypothetical protein